MFILPAASKKRQGEKSAKYCTEVVLLFSSLCNARGEQAVATAGVVHRGLCGCKLSHHGKTNAQ